MTTTASESLDSATGKPDPAFIRRAVELADLNAVRVALYQQTKDPEIAALPVAMQLDDAGRDLLISKAAAWLEKNARPGMPEEPPKDELRQLMNLATKEEMGDLEFEARRELAAFRPFPFQATWSGKRPELPEGFQVAVIGSGFSGLAMAVQLENLGIPYVVLDRQPEPGGTWTIHRYPDIRVDTISITYEFPFEKNYPWKEYFSRGADVKSYLEHISKKYGVYEKTRFHHTLERRTSTRTATSGSWRRRRPRARSHSRPTCWSTRWAPSPTRARPISRVRKISAASSSTRRAGPPALI
jgi:4-hydroxyacetophenone monooxygenase